MLTGLGLNQPATGRNVKKHSLCFQLSIKFRMLLIIEIVLNEKEAISNAY